jgi:voltage-gated potassium channel
LSTQSLRHRIGHALHEPATARGWARRFNQLLTFFIVATVVAMVINTIPEVDPRVHAVLDVLENVSFVVFAVEYVLRVWSAVEIPRFRSRFSTRLKYCIRFLPLVDLAVLLSYFAPFDLRFLRLLRIVRLLRVLHLAAYEAPLRAIGRGIAARRHLLVIAIVAMMTTMFFAAAGMYYIENDAQPKQFPSIPATMWWAIMTLTTVGYGDVYPITPLGKLFAAVIATCGIAVFAMPMAIVTAAILEVKPDEMSRNRSGESDAKKLTNNSSDRPL